MAKLKIGIGFHQSIPNYADGIGDYWKRCAMNGHAVVTKGVRNAGPVFEAQELAEAFPDVPINGIWRMDMFPHGDDVPRYGADPEAEATYYWNYVEKKFPPELDKEFAWVEFPNEADKEESEWLGRFARACGEEAIKRGYRYLCPGWSGGEPEKTQWMYDGWLDYFRLCELFPDQLGISLHEYTFKTDVKMLDTAPYLIGRVTFLNDVCIEAGIQPPTVFISEWGYGAMNAPRYHIGVPDMIDTVDWYIRNAPNVKGVVIWCLDSNDQWTKLSRIIHAYIQPMGDFILNTDWPEPEEPEPIPPPTDDIKVVIWKIAQEHSLTDFMQIAEKAYGEYRRTITSSTDDMTTMLDAGNEESYAVVWDPDYPSQKEAIAAINKYGYGHEYRYLDHAPLPFPSSIKLGYLMKWRYVTTSPFNAARPYANGLHEGQDIDIIGKNPNSKEQILCAYAGIVDRSLDSSGGYGKYVRVAHELDGRTFYTRYCHLDTRNVKVGDLVIMGSEIGEIGTTGNVTGEHLHFNLEIPGFGMQGYVVRDVVDPAPYLPDPSVLPLYQDPPQNVLDLLDYLRGDGRMYEVQHPGGATETFQVQTEGTTFYLVKNSQYESFRFDNEYIWRGVDTSPGPAPSYAEFPGRPRFYDQFEPGQTMARWCMRKMNVGQTYRGPGHWTQFYYKSDCSQSAANSGNATNIVTYAEKLAQYEGYKGVVVKDAIALQTNTGERMIFAKGYGLVGWESDWGSSKICEIHSGRPDLTREHIGCLER